MKSSRDIESCVMLASEPISDAAGSSVVTPVGSSLPSGHIPLALLELYASRSHVRACGRRARIWGGDNGAVTGGVALIPGRRRAACRALTPRVKVGSRRGGGKEEAAP